ncbi:3-hydroxyacyl-CoA dehydrogenase family protein [Granulicella sibirica]|uniref:3-hydroxybutyryl-CoA dehydrogenase n=1 Tax=Granulicella sibirica TaxID=2479048 RepID=A0A4Q0ST90_9BACT|nr:3-hydroxyacyl-CoA dehydrogenase family protein [Granulicella sibirica]RXH54135.1 3-hydroxybutyryl-CoA dehydrogenase [Granulicella sibirica]
MKNKGTALKRVGIVGLGLMGQGIAACLLAHGDEVVAFDVDASKHAATIKHAAAALRELEKQKLLGADMAKSWKNRLHAAASMSDLASCWLVIECVKEDLALKREIFAQLDAVMPKKTIIASNTSSLPISLLQEGRVAPGRYIGMHWGEPAQIMRYLEIIPGEKTSNATVKACLAFGVACGKEPAVLKHDIRGFLSNRLMYAMIREACYLVESGVADVETVDQSFRNDIGWWALLAGPFRWMDLTGIPAYAAVMEGLLPELTTSTEVPMTMQRMVKRKALGIANQKGFYKYTKASAEQWEKDWGQFTYDMRKLAERYTPKV